MNAQETTPAYDLLWKWGVSYIFMSIYLESGYTTEDVISYHNGKDNYLFISKASRKELSEKTYTLFQTGFDQFQRSLETSNAIIREYLDVQREIVLADLDTEALLEHFLEMAEMLKMAWAMYFPLEPHSFDTITTTIQKNINAPLTQNVEKITPIRQEHRALINDLMYPPGPFSTYVAEIERRLGHSVSQYHYQDIGALFVGETLESMPETFALCTRGDEEFIGGEEAKQLFSKLLPAAKETSELKGRVGNKGVYTGKVKKIDFALDTDFAAEVAAMDEGDVLVSGSTGPEMILACKKAGAIVTEEGGMLTHAAIVSRELGIPCVVGTQIATTILHDGDAVEVDGDKGIVRLINKA